MKVYYSIFLTMLLSLSVCVNAQSLKIIRKAASKGDVWAINTLAGYYENGYLVKQNNKKAFKWYKKGADIGDSNAQYNLGRCFIEGIGVNENLEEGLLWWIKAAKQGNTKVQKELAQKYQLQHDYREAIRWWIIVANSSYADSQVYYNLGLCYYQCQCVPNSNAEAVKWFRKAGSFGNSYTIVKEIYKKAAAEGDPVSQYQIGDNYFYGRGETKNYYEAVKWYQKAASQGHAESSNSLGNCYYEGIGVTKNYSEAVRWFQRAAEQGIVEAQNRLGVCYYKGIGISKNYSQAVKWCKEAASQGQVEAQFYLGECYYYGNGVSKSYVDAFRCYQKAAEQGHAEAQYSLGWCYSHGQGVDKSLSIGLRWYRSAAEKGNSSAQNDLGYAYMYGEGVPKNYPEAEKWLKKAVAQGNSKAEKNLNELRKKMKPLCPDSFHPHAIDLGLSVKWSCCNLGASNPWGYGSYYSWGEVYSKYSFSRYNYDYCYACGPISFCFKDIGADISGTSYDAATNNNSDTCMPSYGECAELLNRCDYEWTSENNIYGVLFTGPNGNKLFFPAAGSDNGKFDRGVWGRYWTSLGNHTSEDASALHLGEDHKTLLNTYRPQGFSIRPVYK